MKYSVAGVAERNGKFFIALRNPGTSIGERWEFPGGKMEEGEGHEQALIREYREELGTDITVGSFLCEGDFSNGVSEYHLVAYNIKLKDDNLALTEHQKVMWASLEQMENLDFPFSDKIIIDYLLSR